MTITETLDIDTLIHQHVNFRSHVIACHVAHVINVVPPPPPAPRLPSYRLPQLLRAEKVLTVDAAIASAIDDGAELPVGDSREVEIRLATLVAGEDVRVAAEEAAGRTVTVRADRNPYPRPYPRGARLLRGHSLTPTDVLSPYRPPVSCTSLTDSACLHLFAHFIERPSSLCVASPNCPLAVYQLLTHHPSSQLTQAAELDYFMWRSCVDREVADATALPKFHRTRTTDY
jgi:hypothetical protein